MDVPGVGHPCPPEPFHQSPLGCAIFSVTRREVHIEGCRFGVLASRSRALPWLWILRVPRLGHGVPLRLIPPLVQRLRTMASTGGVLRVHVEGWATEPRVLASLAEACEASGFQEVSSPRSYRDTIWLDLSGTEEEILAGFHKTGRANIRAAEKRGFTVRHLTDTSMASHLRALHEAAFERTGGAPPRLDWDAILHASRTAPDQIRAVGLFEEGGSEAPLGFAVGVCHGEVAEYAFAGSIRSPDVNVPLLYAPTWDLMRWARRCGARWWDFGGVTVQDVRDTRSGITDFKRYFSSEVTRVGAEWTYEPRPLLAAGVRAAATAFGRVRG